MKFYSPIKQKPQPKDGDTKKVKRYAWYPVRIDDNVIWMEYYNELFVFSSPEIKMPFCFDRWYSKGFELIHNQN